MTPVKRWAWAAALAILGFVLLRTLYNWDRNVSPFRQFRAHLAQNPIRSRWTELPQRYPVSSFIQLPSGAPAQIPWIQRQFPEESAHERNTRLQRLASVRENFEHAWHGYRTRAWGKDEVSPLSGGSNDFFGGWAATLVDSLDTLWIMGFRDEFNAAAEAAAGLNFSTSTSDDLNVFETNIRYLGGLLAAYDLSGDHRLLRKALELGEMLYVAFDTPNRLPITRWKWKKALEGVPQQADGWVIASELGSFSIEFTRLSQLSGDPKYFDAAQRITDLLRSQQMTSKLPGLWPVVFNAKDSRLDEGGDFGLGAFADSLYEYLPKEHMLLGGLRSEYREMYETAIDVAKQHLFFRPLNPEGRDILLSGSAKVDDDGRVTLEPQAQHLACFVGGMVGIGARIFDRPDDLAVARKLVDGCIWAYNATTSGMMPEVFYAAPCADDCAWDERKWHDAIAQRASSDDPAQAPADLVRERRLPPGVTDIRDRRYMLRPEAIESVFILYRITGDRALREQGWAMFEAVARHARTPLAHAALDDVTVAAPPQADRMESFWTAETLKYYYLLFAEESVVSLDEYVFNTEAHTFRRPK